MMEKKKSGGVIEADCSRQMGRYEKKKKERSFAREFCVYTRGDKGTNVRCRSYSFGWSVWLYKRICQRGN